MLVVSKNCSLPRNSILYITVAPSDYGSLDMVLMFGECERRKCINVPIVDDTEDEQDEYLVYNLTRTLGLNPNIILDPVNGVIEIEDDDEGLYNIRTCS